jgi:hypothetical protein
MPKHSNLTKEKMQISICFGLEILVALLGFGCAQDFEIEVQSVEASGVAEGCLIKDPENPVHLDIVFLMDTTGSMSPSINGVRNSFVRVKNRVSEILREGHTDRVQFGLAEFKDGQEGYRLRQTFTSNSSQFESKLNLFMATGGGDEAEKGLFALYHIMTDSALGWRSSARKIVIMVSDASSHDISAADGFTMDALHKKLESSSFRFLGLAVRNDSGSKSTQFPYAALNYFEPLAERSNGVVFRVNASGTPESGEDSIADSILKGLDQLIHQGC